MFRKLEGRWFESWLSGNSDFFVLGLQQMFKKFSSSGTCVMGGCRLALLFIPRAKLLKPHHTSKTCENYLGLTERKSATEN